MNQTVEHRRTAGILSICLVLFYCRVTGQFLVEYCHVTFLPPSNEWFSGVIPYPQLLGTQLVIMLFMGKVTLDLARGKGTFSKPRRAIAYFLLTFGIIYLSVMVVRYAVRMSLYPEERWTGGSIPIFFHWVLAIYILIWGQWNRKYSAASNPDSRFPQWLICSSKVVGATFVFSLFSLWIVYLTLPSLLIIKLGGPAPKYATRLEKQVGFKTRDGIRLAADIYHPVRAGEKTPTILVRLPYEKTWKPILFSRFFGRVIAEQGYTMVVQGTRGMYDSEGDPTPFLPEREDGFDTLDWISEQPWYNGKVGMWGGSYFGYTQWAVADRQENGLSASFNYESSTDFYSMFHEGGAFSLWSALWWASTSKVKSFQDVTEEVIRRGVEGFPLIESDDRAVGDVPHFNDWVTHSRRDAYWFHIDGKNRAANLAAPVYLMAGWFDPLLATNLKDFTQIRKNAASEVAEKSRLVIGPWIHAGKVNHPDMEQEMDFRLNSLLSSLGWFDQHLRNNKSDPYPPVQIYVMGSGQWRDEQEWPLKRTQYKAFYLHSDGSANTAKGDGKLSPTLPTTPESADRFIYDPLKPVPTTGGATLGFTSHPANDFTNGRVVQNLVEQREDILVYSSSPLEQDVEATGHITATLFVETDAVCTDFTAKLVDVFPDGTAYNICDSIRRRNYTEQAEGPVKIQINVGATSNLFKKGHRIRLQISSSNFPRFDRNPNTGGSIPTEIHPVKASQAVHHGPNAASFLLLPIIPQGS